MRINQTKIPPTLDGEIRLPDCPIFREEAEKALMLLTRMPPFSYGSVKEFQGIVVAEYWRFYDGLDAALEKHTNSREYIWFREWYVKQATDPDRIQRALRWLVEKEYIVLTPTVRERAGKFAEATRNAFAGSKE